MQAEKFSVHLGNVRLRVATESPSLRNFLQELGFEVRNTLAAEGLLLGRPATGRDVGRPAWVLYESGSVVLRRSLSEDDVFEAASYHLRTVQSAVQSQRLALLARVIVLPSGAAWLFDPFVWGELAGLDRRMLRAGCTVLPTTVVSIDTRTCEVVLPVHEFGDALPSGRLPVERMLYRPWPGDVIDGVEMFRLARMVVRHRGTDLAVVLEQVHELAYTHLDVLTLAPDDVIRRAIVSLCGGG